MLAALRPTTRVLANHARTPLISFPDRHSGHDSHGRTVHPCAPADLASSSPFLSSLAASGASSSNAGSNKHGSSKDNDTSGPLLGPAGGSAPGSGFESDAPPTRYEEWNLPAHLSRSRWAPSGDELDAIMTGGASVTADVTRQIKQKWYTPQI
ncbi:hypothetical protein OIV83_000155 [Microbotryomycetes sp. JL201]|nr:hypothetical protein OIV83_000155 [Microbotryomycetes sp. JL201]